MAFFQEQPLILNSIETDRKRPLSDYFRSAWEKILANYQLYILFTIPAAFIIGSFISPFAGIALGLASYVLVVGLFLFQTLIFKIKTAASFGLIYAEQYLPDGTLDETIEAVIEKAIPLENDVTIHTQYLYSYFEALKQTSDDHYSELEQEDNLDENYDTVPVDLRNIYMQINQQAKQLRSVNKEKAKPNPQEKLNQIDIFIKAIELSRYDLWFVKFRRMYYLDGFPYRFMFVCLPKGTKSIDDVWVKTKRQLFIEGVIGEAPAYVPNLLLVGEWLGAPIYVTIFTQDDLREFIGNVHRPPVKKNNYDWADARLAIATVDMNFAYGATKKADSLEKRLMEQRVLSNELIKYGTDNDRQVLEIQSMLDQDHPPPDEMWKKILIYASIFLLFCFAYYSCAYDVIGMPEIFGPFKQGRVSAESSQPEESVPVEGSIGRILHFLIAVFTFGG